MRTVFSFSLLGLVWQVIGAVVMFNSRIGEVKHLEGAIMLLSGLIVVAIMIKKD